MKMTQMISLMIADARNVQIFGQSLFLSWGILFFGWHEMLGNVALAIFSCLFFQTVAIALEWAQWHSLRSAMITGLGLSLLLRVNDPIWMVVAALLGIGQKFILKWRGYHFWNPANFAIAVLVLFTQEAWISPAQWGQQTEILVLIFWLGLLILGQIHRWDTALFYMSTLSALVFLRFQFFLNWDFSVTWHQLTNGSFWLYSLFMITDPMSTPQHKWLRRIWAMLLAGLTFYLQYFHFIPAAAIWSLAVMTTIVPLINIWSKGNKFRWNSEINK